MSTTKKSATTAKKKTSTKRTTAPKQETPAKVPVYRSRIKAVVPLHATSAGVIVNKQVNGFVDFLREQSVVGLAIGLVLGTQVKQLVDAMVLNFFNPFIGLFLPGKGALDAKTFTLHFNDKVATFGYGAFVMTLLNFIIVAAIVYFVFKGLKLDRLAKKKEEEPKEEPKKKDADKKSKSTSKKK